MKNVFYFHYINAIGGVETMFYELAKKYADHDITVFYSSGNTEQIERIARYVRIRKIPEEVRRGTSRIKCERVFFNYNMKIDWFDAKNYFQVVHADYMRQMELMPQIDDRLSGYIAVSKTAATSFKERTGIDCIVCYNPITIEEEDRKMRLNLISATRLTREKGFGRMKKLIELLDQRGISYSWEIFTNSPVEIASRNVVLRQPRLDIRKQTCSADILVQLSDSEGWCYSINEALCLGTKVISTRLPSIEEMEGDIIYLDLDLSNISDVVDQIEELSRYKNEYMRAYKASYEPKADAWDELLVEGESTYRKETGMKYRVRATEEFRNVNDTSIGRPRDMGEEFEVSEERLRVLEAFRLSGKKVKLIEVIERIEEKPASEPENASAEEVKETPEKKEKAPKKAKETLKNKEKNTKSTKTARKSQNKS